MASITASKTTESCRLAPLRSVASGIPARSTTTWRFVPGLPRSVGFAPTRSPPFGRDAGAVQTGPAPVDLAGLAQPIQQFPMEPVPDAGLVPIAQAGPAGHARAATQSLGQHLPGNATLQHEDDAGQGRAIRHAGSAALGLGR